MVAKVDSQVDAGKGEFGGAVVLVPDPRHRLPGRGAWLHPSTACLEQAVRRKAFTRALRLPAGPVVAPVAEHLNQISTQPKAGHAE
ncbi:MAG TPA: YlxR family protein [Lapillicoccus sp.]